MNIFHAIWTRATFPIASSCFFRALALTPSQTMLKLAAAVLLCVAALGSAFTTPLDEYIALPDPTYSFYDTVRRHVLPSQLILVERHVLRPWLQCLHY